MGVGQAKALALEHEKTREPDRRKDGIMYGRVSQQKRLIRKWQTVDEEQEAGERKVGYE